MDEQNFVCEYVYNGNGSSESASFWEAIGKKRIDIIDRKSEMATGYRFADCGKNLFDKRKIIPGYFYNKDKRVTNNEYVLSHIIPVISSKTYYISNTGVGMYGWEIPRYTGGSGNNSDGKKYSMLNFAQVMIELAESEKYKNFMIVVPLYAMMDHINGYGPIVELALCDLYESGVKQKVGQQGRDGVHPKWEAGGLREVARAYEPVVLHYVV